MLACGAQAADIEAMTVLVLMFISAAIWSLGMTGHFVVIAFWACALAFMAFAFATETPAERQARHAAQSARWRARRMVRRRPWMRRSPL
jgi:hypothetical protein